MSRFWRRYLSPTGPQAIPYPESAADRLLAEESLSNSRSLEGEIVEPEVLGVTETAAKGGVVVPKLEATALALGQ